jgi:hypothetical protein
MWQMLRLKLNAYSLAVTSIHELWERVQVEWDKITMEKCLKVIFNMPESIQAVFKAKGGIQNIE